jgi:hypothetical protein
MSDWLDRLRRSRARATIPTIWVAFVLSFAFHAALLWGWQPRDHEPSLEHAARGKASGPLVLQLAPQPAPATSAPPALPSAPAVAAPPPRRAPPAKPAPRTAPTPPVIAQERPAPVAAPRPPEPVAAAPAPTPVEGDFSSFLEARRRARGAAPQDFAPSAPSAPSSEDERERHNRAVTANLGLNRAPTFGRDLSGGGVFQIQRLGADSAEFVFFGWNREIQRNSTQRIDVRRGDNPDIRIAVVRRMIEIIRDNESGDFTWVSRRLGRDVTLSARPGDNAGLEDFMMQEFFGDVRARP